VIPLECFNPANNDPGKNLDPLGLFPNPLILADHPYTPEDFMRIKGEVPLRHPAD